MAKRNGQEPDLRLHQLLQITNQAARIGSWEFDLTTQSLYWSDVTREIHEVPPDYVPTVETAIEFYLEGYCRTAIQKAVEACIEKGEPYDLELQIRTATGKIKWVRALGTADRFEGKTFRIYGSFQDIHEQKLMQLALDKRTQEYRSLFDHNPHGVYSLDNEGRFTDVNEQLLQIAQCTREQIIGQHYSIFTGPDNKAYVDDIFQRVRNGERLEYQLTVRDLHGNPRHIQVTAMPMVVNGRVEGSYGVVSDIGEKLRMQALLHESEERFRLAMEGARDGIWDLDLRTGKNYVSEQFAKMLGFTLEQVYDDAFFKSRFHPEDAQRRLEVMEEHLSGKRPFYDLEIRIKTGSGKYRWFLTRGKALWDENGKPVRITGSLTDIHEEKMLRQQLESSNRLLRKHEAQLLRSLQLLDAFVKGLPDNILQVDNRGRIYYLHIPQNTVLFANLIPAVGDDIATCISAGPILLQAVRTCIHRREPQIVEFKEWRSNTTYYFEARITPAADKKALIIIRNVTAQHKAQQELIRQELKYTSLIENMHLGILEVDNEQNITKAHPGFCKMTGYEAEELVGKNAMEVFSPPSEKEKLLQATQRRKHAQADYYETQILKKNGEKIDVLVSGAPLYDDMGNIVGSVGIHHDITHYKRTARLLEDSNRIGKIGTFEIDLLQQKITWNDLMWEIFETEQDFHPNLSQLMAFYIPGASRERAEELYESMQKDVAYCDEVFEIRSGRGNRKWIRILAATEMAGAKAARIVGIVQDVTTLKQYEVDLKNYSNLTETILTSIEDGLLVLDKDDNIIFHNESAGELLQQDNKRWLGANLWEVFPQAHEIFDEIYTKVKTSGKAAERVYAYTNHHVTTWLSLKAYPTRTGGVSFLYRDITGEKAQEQAIRSLNAKYQAISRATNQIIFEWKLTTGEVEFNDVFFDVTGYDADDAIHSIDFHLKNIHPDDIDRFQQSLQQCIARKNPAWAFGYRYKIADGSYRHLHARSTIQFDKSGNALTILGTVEDVTERIRLNEKLVTEKVNAQRKINEAVIVAQEQEREFIGRELHDNVNQILTTAGLYLQLAESEGFTSAGTIEQIRQFIQKAIDEIRVLSRRLTPPSLKDIGLSVAMVDMISQVAKASPIKFRFNIAEELDALLGKDKSLVIYRITQELINNVLKYAHASECRVILEKTPDHHVRLVVKDNGKGFDIAKTKKGVGLNSSIARVEVYGGTVNMQSSPGKGCTVTIEIPL